MVISTGSARGLVQLTNNAGIDNWVATIDRRITRWLIDTSEGIQRPGFLVLVSTMILCWCARFYLCAIRKAYTNRLAEKDHVGNLVKGIWVEGCLQILRNMAWSELCTLKLTSM